jgi:hypothetical protein
MCFIFYNNLVNVLKCLRISSFLPSSSRTSTVVSRIQSNPGNMLPSSVKCEYFTEMNVTAMYSFTCGIAKLINTMNSLL